MSYKSKLAFYLFLLFAAVDINTKGEVQSALGVVGEEKPISLQPYGPNKD